MFDLIGSEEVAQEALISAFVTRPDLFDAVEFDGRQTLGYGQQLLSDSVSRIGQTPTGPT